MNIPGLSSARGRVLAGLAVAAIAVTVAAVVVGAPGGPSSKGYCLYAGTSLAGNSGTLAVPDANATQGSCNAVEESVQILFANWQTRDESFAISSDRPVTLSSRQAATLRPFASQPGWLIYSGSV